jgi:hypothetical protein
MLLGLQRSANSSGMPDAAVENELYQKWIMLVDDLDERARRRWAATEAMAIGRGGIVAVAEATGLSDRTVRSGITEIRSGDVLPAGYQRRPGGGRKPLGSAETRPSSPWKRFAIGGANWAAPVIVNHRVC